MDRAPERSKSFKALSMAQPIRKDIQQTLNQLQQEKRQFLANERQQALLKQQLQKKRKQLNALKAQVPVTQTDQKRTSQTNLKLKNTDRTYQKTLGNIQRLKDEIDTARKRVSKLKEYNTQLFADQKQVIKNIDELVSKIEQKQRSNQTLKAEIVNYRQNNIKNLTQFRKSHMNLSKSNFKDENERRKYAVSTKTFLGEQIKQSRVVHYDRISDLLKSGGIATNQGRADILAESVPIAKARVNVLIHKNKQKTKIAQNYMKFGEGLQSMFKIMKQYKGRDDVDYLAEQFVKKQKQIQKLGQYIGKLEYRIVSANRLLQKKQLTKQQLEQQLQKNSSTHMQSEQHYKQMSLQIKKDIQQLKNQNLKMNDWLKRIGEIVCPLADDPDFSRGNAINVMGKIEQRLGINRSHVERKNTSPAKQPQVPVLQVDEHQKYAELMSYDKMKQYADEYIRSKKTV